MLCILYVVAISTCLGTAGSLAELAFPARWPRRWLWCGLIALTVLVPPLFQAWHVMPVGHLLSREAVTAVSWATINTLWLFTSAVILLWGIAHAIHTWRTMAASPVAASSGAAPRVIDGVAVLVTPVLGPATVGVWRAKIVVPLWVTTLPRLERRYVLQHEEEHRRAKDALVMLLASLTVVLIPWNLPLYWLQRRLRAAIEMDCDDRVVRALGDARAYGATLLAVAEAGSRDPRLQLGFLGGTGSLERRIRSLLEPSRHSATTSALAFLVSGALLLMALSVPHPVLGHAPSATDHPRPSATHAVGALR